MTAPDQDPAKLLEVAQIASDILFENGAEIDPYSRPITPNEALLMSAIAHLLTDNMSFYPSEVATLLGKNPGYTPRFLRKFKEEYGILDSLLDPKSSGGGWGKGRPRLKYVPTELGHIVFGVFETQEQ